MRLRWCAFPGEKHLECQGSEMGCIFAWTRSRGKILLVISLWREDLLWLNDATCVGKVGRLWNICCCTWFWSFVFSMLGFIGNAKECRSSFIWLEKLVWYTLFLYLEFNPYTYRGHWRERNCCPFEDMEALVVQLKSSFIRKLIEWSLAFGLVSFQSVIDFVDSLFSIVIPFFL